MGILQSISFFRPCCVLNGQALVNDIHTIQPSLNGINEVGLHLKKEAEPLFAVHIQKELDDLNGQWEMVCKQVCVCVCVCLI